ncbi:MAG: hypothetical protein IT328_20150 [Caldilineaceae bacterium]|nr:hypothetical protein [Caldilineaceae bacterium]
MKTLYFVNPLANQTEVTVAAVNDGQPLTYGEGYEVSDDLAQGLLANEIDWQLSAPRAMATPGDVPVVPAKSLLRAAPEEDDRL